MASTVDPKGSLTDWRCSHCGRLLAKVDVQVGHVEILCPSCKPKRMNVLVVKEGTIKAVEGR